MTGPSPTGTASSPTSPTRDPETTARRQAAGIAEAVLTRDRLVVLGGLGAISLLAWGYTVRLATGSGQHGGGDHAALVFAMWAAMMVAMMTPSAAPTVLTFARLHRGARAATTPYVPTAWFLAGYLLVWTWFSYVATLTQFWLHAEALATPMGESISPVLSGILLVAAGAFQWTPMKGACLRHCRSPFGFLVQNWRDGRVGALEMGIRHGGFCVACCWTLVLLLFVLGVMNLLWMAAVTALVLVEKMLPGGQRIGQAAGALLAVWGVWLLLAL